MEYEIIYDYTDDGGYESRNNVESFTGDWLELQDYIKQMKKQGCYNIYVSATGE
jgi:hypothetical protein